MRDHNWRRSLYPAVRLGRTGEAGDHEHLIHLRGTDFRQLMEKLPHSVISAGKEYSRWVYE